MAKMDHSISTLNVEKTKTLNELNGIIEKINMFEKIKSGLETKLQDIDCAIDTLIDALNRTELLSPTIMVQMLGEKPS